MGIFMKWGSRTNSIFFLPKLFLTSGDRLLEIAHLGWQHGFAKGTKLVLLPPPSPWDVYDTFPKVKNFKIS